MQNKKQEQWSEGRTRWVLHEVNRRKSMCACTSIQRQKQGQFLRWIKCSIQMLSSNKTKKSVKRLSSSLSASLPSASWVRRTRPDGGSYGRRRKVSWLVFSSACSWDWRPFQIAEPKGDKWRWLVRADGTEWWLLGQAVGPQRTTLLRICCSDFGSWQGVKGIGQYWTYPLNWLWSCLWILLP